jgi:hypothetical protein
MIAMAARATTFRLAVLTLAASSLLLSITPTSRPRREALPLRLDDRMFWSLVTEFSEPNGSFRSDNLVSNELTFEHVIPALQAQVTPASAYIGVGPDQNFTYIAALRPKVAFIVDIRRQNMLLHLMYKALLELSSSRAEFLSRLFSRPVPATDVADNATADALLAAFHDVEPNIVMFERTQQEIRHRLIDDHGFTLTQDDLAGIDYVFRAFFGAGPEIRYAVGRGSGWQPFPSYEDLMVAHDGDGVQRSYLATEDLYLAVRDMEERNLIVPVVGDFAGPKALRSVARFLDLYHATVSMFYTSNVEQYLFGARGDAWQRFYRNVAALPLDSRSTFVRAFFNNQGRVMMFSPPQVPPSGGRPDGIRPVPGPRSVTLLNPIAVLLAAFSEGHISSYYDVVELSR